MVPFGSLCLPEMRENGLDDYWIQKDGTPCHTVNQTMQYLVQILSGRVVLNRGENGW